MRARPERQQALLEAADVIADRGHGAAVAGQGLADAQARLGGAVLRFQDLLARAERLDGAGQLRLLALEALTLLVEALMLGPGAGKLLVKLLAAAQRDAGQVVAAGQQRPPGLVLARRDAVANLPRLKCEPGADRLDLEAATPGLFEGLHLLSVGAVERVGWIDNPLR